MKPARALLGRRLLSALALAVLIGSGPAGAQDGEPPVRLDPVVVTPGRLEQPVSETPAAVTVITRDDIRESASQTVDDLLRQVPGFSLFRRTSSLVAHPTTQGVSLRGIGPSGGSRALVLLDDVPINDPFGGWVYWNRVPLLGLGQVEVVRGGGSSVWGNFALGGVVHLRSRPITERAFEVDASYGNRDTWNVGALLHEVWGPARIGLEGHAFATEGYHIVKRSRRGAIDIPADSDHETVNGRLEWVLSPDTSVFVGANYYEEDRGNGTPLQINDTTAASLVTGARLRTADGSGWTVSLFGHDQEFRSTFSAQDPDRNAETLVLDQRVPTVSLGGALQWTRQFGAHRWLSGADLRWIQGETDEDVFVAGAFARRRVAGGEQLVTGAYVQDIVTPAPAWELTGGLRADYWLTYDASRRDVPPPAGIPTRQDFDDVDRLAVSPRLAVLWRPADTTVLRASGYQGFRAPTLNELYRLFRVRNDVTAANPRLKPERLTGGEAGVQQRWGPLQARVTGFWNEVTDLIANVTLAAPLPDCPAGTTCRQRQNLERARIRGVETELELQLGRGWRLLASHLFTDARVVDAPQQPDLEGNRLAQVPQHTYTLGVRYEHPALVNVSATGRFVGRQFEDDANTLPLGSFFVLDLVVSRRIVRWADVYVAVENVFDTTYSTGRTSEGVESIGAPRLYRGGIRLLF